MHTKSNQGHDGTFAPGQRLFERYVLKFLAGRGGMGVVWCALDERLDLEVALKFLPEIILDDPVALEDLRKETKRCLQLTHPNIVRIYDFVDDGETGAIAMEFVKGQALNKLKGDQRDHHFEVAQLHPLVVQLCDTLAYAHTGPGIVHRDVKPANLILTDSNELKVTDFGIARNITDSVSRLSVRANDSSGTPGYMSPQQAMGDRPSVADDVYSVGATLYDLLTSRPPFYAGDIPLQILNKVPPSVAERRVELGHIGGQSVPAVWEEVIAACLEKAPTDRPESVAEIKVRLGTPPVVDELDNIALTQSPIINRGGPEVEEPLPTRLPTRPATSRPGTAPSSRRSQHGTASVAEPSAATAASVAAPESVQEQTDEPVAAGGRSITQWILLLTIGLFGAAAIGILAAYYLDPDRIRDVNDAVATGPTDGSRDSDGQRAGDPRAEVVPAESGEDEKATMLAMITELRKQTGQIKEASDAKDETLEELREEMARLQQQLAESRERQAAAVLASETASQKNEPPGVARVTIVTAPAGAALTVDGDAAENYANGLELPPGEHRFRVTYKDWKPLERTVILNPGDNPELDLSLRFGTLVLDSVPPGASLSVDGKSVGSAPCEILGEAGRSYRVAATYRDWSPFEQDHVVTEEGKTERTLSIPHGTVEFASEPPGANVKLGGMSMKTPCSMMVQAGKDLTAAFKYQSWRPVERSFRVEDRQTRDVFCRIPHGTLSVTASSSGVGAVVYADGDRLGYIQKGGSEFLVQAGTRDIQVSGDTKFRKVHQRITVADGEKSRLDEIAFTGINFKNAGPAGVEVWINGKMAGRTPFFHELAGSSSLQLKFVKAGYRPGSDQIVVSRGKIRDYPVTLEPVRVAKEPRRVREEPKRIPEKKEPEKTPEVAPAPKESPTAPPEPAPTKELASGPPPGFHFTNGLGMSMRWISTVRGGFWASAHETTRTQYKRLMGSDPSDFTSSPLLPVQNVSYQQALEFCGALLAQERKAGRIPPGYTYHLPSVAEWRQMLGNHSGNFAINSYVVWKRSQAAGPAIVGSLKSPNQLGLHDVRGNMMEWCREKTSRGYRILAGGSWSTQVKAATKDTTHKTSSYSENNTGFRVILVKTAR